MYTGNRDNLREIANHPYFSFIRHDVTFPLFVEVDEIFNCAAPASISGWRS